MKEKQSLAAMPRTPEDLHAWAHGRTCRHPLCRLGLETVARDEALLADSEEHPVRALLRFYAEERPPVESMAAETLRDHRDWMRENRFKTAWEYYDVRNGLFIALLIVAVITGFLFSYATVLTGILAALALGIEIRSQWIGGLMVSTLSYLWTTPLRLAFYEAEIQYASRLLDSRSHIRDSGIWTIGGKRVDVAEDYSVN